MHLDSCSMAPPPIEPSEILLHIGVHKTGTTALQSALADARPDLEAHGVRYPGTSTFQHGAVLAGAGRTHGWQEDTPEQISSQPWEELVKQARYDGRTVISSEFFDDLDEATARRMIDQLGGPQRVRIAVTLRPIGAILPSAWQQRLKTGYSAPYSQFLKQIFAEKRTAKALRFWYRHDQVEQVARWTGIVGADRTYAVMVPDGDRTAIFSAFESLLRLPQGFLAQRPVQARNRSMTAPEAEFVRRLNKEVADELTWDDYVRTVRRGLVLTMVESRQPGPDESRILTPRWAADKAQEYGQRFAKGIADSGVTVIGDPAALATRPRSGRSGEVHALPMDAAVAGAAALVRRSSSGPGAPTRSQALRTLFRRARSPKVGTSRPITD